MNATPTLSDLALYAHDHFGEDGRSFDASEPSSFELVVEVYTREAPEKVEEIKETACERLEEHLCETQEAGPELRGEVEEFVDHTLQFLSTQYPEVEEAQQEQDMLGTLFRGHLVEARFTGR